MKKIKNLIIIFLMIMVFGIPNVYAGTALVNTTEELYSALSNADVDLIKLEKDVLYNDSTDKMVYSTNKTKVLDLNGYTLSSAVPINLRVTDSNTVNEKFNFTITDSSIAKTGKISSETTNDFMRIWIYKLTDIFTFKIDGGVYESNGGSSRFFWFGNGTTGNDPRFDVVFENAKFYGKYILIGTQAFNLDNSQINLNNIEYYKAPSGSSIRIYDEDSRTLSSLFDSTKNDLYIDDVLYTTLDDKLNGTYDGKFGIIATDSFKIKSKTQLTLVPVTMSDKEYGYTSSSYDLSIKNNTSTSIELKSITLSNTSAFEIVGSMPQTINGNSSNNVLKIKTKTGLNAGTYSTSITVTDTNDNVYDFGEVTFKVTKATINPTITMNSWIYGETASDPSVTNNPSDGTITYSYTNSSGTSTTTKPNKPDDYKLKVTISEDTNYKAFNSGEINFKIYKKELIISNLTISDKYYNYSNPSLNVSQVTYNINVADVTYVSYITPNSESDLNVGKGSAQVFITIKTGDYSQYYCFAGDNTIEVIEEAAYEILPTNINFTLTHSGSDDETNTTISVNKGTSLDLLSLFDLDETSLKNRVTYSLTGTPTGVSISDKNLVVENTSVTQTVGVQLTFPAYDNDSDGTNEINSKIQNIYIKITDKEVVTITGLDDNQEFTYDGSSKTPFGTITVQDNKVAVSELEVTYNGIDGTTYNSTIPPINAGKYTVTYKVSDSNPTYHGVITYNFTINKINPIYTVPTDLIGIKNNALDTITLSDGFVWMNSSTVMNDAGNKTFLVKYVPTDTDNYNTIEDISVEVYVKGLFDVTTNSLGNGTITTSTTGVLEGTTVEVILTPNTGYIVDEVLVNGVKKEATNNILSIEVLEDLTIEVSFKKQQFSIDITGTNLNGLNIDPSSITYVDYGTDKDIMIEVKDGYKILSIKVNGVDKELIDNKLSLTNVTVNYLIEIDVEELEKEKAPEEPKETEKPTVTLPGTYQVIEGANQEVIIDDKEDAKFKINADYSLFMAVYVNNKLLDPSNYIVENGSTIVILKQSYLETLDEGKYTLKVVFKDSKEVQTNFTVSKEKVEENVDSKETVKDKKDTKEITEDKKEENTFKLWYLLGALVIIGIIILIYRRNKEEK